MSSRHPTPSFPIGDPTELTEQTHVQYCMTLHTLHSTKPGVLAPLLLNWICTCSVLIMLVEMQSGYIDDKRHLRLP